MSSKQKKRIPGNKMTWMWILLMSLFFSELLFYTWCRVQSVRVGYEITQETKRHQRLLMFQNNLRIEMARLKAPERITSIAKNQLGLKVPEPEQILITK